MSDDPNNGLEAESGSEAESESLWAEIARIRDRFQSDWTSGKQPRMEDFLGTVPQGKQGILLRELLILELVYRHKHHEHPRLEEYRSRFPEHSDLVETVFRSDQETIIPPVSVASSGNMTSRPVDPAREPSDLVDIPSVGHANAPPNGRSAGSHFRILRFHRRGGLGQVWVARDEQLHRDVALKELHKHHASNPDSRSRFVTEAEITGALEHPGIVPVYGIGQHEDGRPYYAMRFIRGDSLKEAIEQFHQPHAASHDPRQRELELRKLLAAFNSVCNTIQYAHSRGVLHRDLKPANIMLGQYGEALVVDWGLAKSGITGAGQPAETGTRSFQPASSGNDEPTRIGSALGTPQYMSPEQAAGRWDEVGPASDVYSLGATLYCLLTGKPSQTSGSATAILENVQRGEFPRPREVKRGVPKALEAICLKAMALRPADRYPSAKDLALDIERWLADEPVFAYEESVWQKATRWARRHRGFVRAALVGLIGLTIASLAAALVIHDAQRREARARAQAKKEAATSREVSKFLLRLFEAPDLLGFAGGTNVELRRRGPEQADLTARELLDRGAKRIEKELVDQPEIRATLMDRIGGVYTTLGLFDKSVKMLREALDLRRKILPPDHPDIATSLHNLAWALICRGDYHAAEPLCREALSLRRRYPGEKLARLTSTMHNLAVLLTFMRQYDEAERLYREAIAIRREQFGNDHQAVAISLAGLAALQLERGDEKQARLIVLEVWHIFCETEGIPRSGRLVGEHQRGLAALSAEKYQEAEERLRSIPPTARKVFGDSHPFVAWVLYDYGRALRGLKRLEQAEQALLEAEQIATLSVRPDHSRVLLLRKTLAMTYSDMGTSDSYDKAVTILREVVQDENRIGGKQSADVARTLGVLGEVHRRSGQLADAVQTHREALGIARKVWAEEPDQVERQMEVLARCLMEKGDLDEAESIYRELLARQQHRNAGAAAVGKTLGLLIELYEAWNKPEKAAEYRQQLPKIQPP